MLALTKINKCRKIVILTLYFDPADYTSILTGQMKLSEVYIVLYMDSKNQVVS